MESQISCTFLADLDTKCNNNVSSKVTIKGGENECKAEELQVLLILIQTIHMQIFTYLAVSFCFLFLNSGGIYRWSDYLDEPDINLKPSIPASLFLPLKQSPKARLACWCPSDRLQLRSFQRRNTFCTVQLDIELLAKRIERLG